MPIIRVEMLAGRSQQQKADVAEVFTRELARIARCNTSDVQVLFYEVEMQNWALDGKLPDAVEAVLKQE